MSKKLDATLILPCYNEAEHFEESVKRIFQVLKDDNRRWEVIFIDDKSTDSTAEKIKKLYSNQYGIAIRAFFHPQNRGRGVTVTHGIKEAKGAIVGFIDIDCEVAPHYIPLFIKRIKEGSDIVYAWRIYQFELSSLVRYFASKAYTVLSRRLLEIDFPDTEAGFKFFRKERIVPILPKIKSKHWFWDTEILVRGKKAGLKLTYIPTVFLRRKDKTSTVNLITDTIDYLRNLWRLRKEIFL